MLLHRKKVFVVTVFGIVVTFVVVVWKKLFYKNTFSWGWFGIYIYLVKTMVEFEAGQKVV